MKEKNSRSCIHSVWEAGKATEIYDIVPLFNISDHVIGSIYIKNIFRCKPLHFQCTCKSAWWC